jgi:hypothetical protein
MPRVGFEPTIPLLVRAKTFHTLEHAATAIGYIHLVVIKFHFNVTI